MKNNYLIKNPIIMSKHSLKENHPSGNLFEEISEQDMTLVAGGTNDWASKMAANAAGLGGYGRICTVSAECNFTSPCG